MTARAEQREDGAVEVSPDAAGPLVRRMLCLDWDGDAFAALPDRRVRALDAMSVVGGVPVSRRRGLLNCGIEGEHGVGIGPCVRRHL